MNTPTDRFPNFLGLTVVNVDLENGNVMNNTDLPGWLNDILGRLFPGNGLVKKKKLASEKAISELKDVALEEVANDKCPICFEEYEAKPKQEQTSPFNEDLTLEKAQQLATKFDRVSKENDEILEKLAQNGTSSIESIRSKSRFTDPSLFFPTDVGATIPFRFPSQNISTMMPVNEDGLLPGINKKKQTQEEPNCHYPVKMPGCNHIFGRSCLVEWLKSNVSCPLCRKEVESEADDNGQIARLNRVMLQVSSTFNPDSDVAEHVLSYLTNVFRPFRRSPNPLITPLTDSYTLQSWGTPSYPPRPERRVASRDPSLILPRRFPVTLLDIHEHRLNQVRPRVPSTLRTRLAPTSLRTETSENDNEQSSTNEESRDGTPDPFNDTGSTSSLDSALPLSSITRSTGQGGPERSRRGNGSGRSHPYNRPFS